MLPGGETTVRCGNMIYLVANVLPGERIIFRDQGRRRGAFRGELVEVLDASSHRVPAPCPYAAGCGGCSLQFLDRGQHAEVKSRWVRDAFSSLMGSSADWLPVTSPPRIGLRRKVRWHRGEDEQGCHLGFRARAGKRVVRHRQCMLLLPSLNELRMALEPCVSREVDGVSMIGLADGIHVILETGTETRPELPDGLLDRKATQWWWRTGEWILPLRRRKLEFHDHLLLAEDLIMALQIGPGDFVQADSLINSEMIQQVRVWSGHARRLVDLFAGAGNFSLPLAAQGLEVTGADIRSASVQAANANARRLGVNACYHVADLLGDFDPAPFAGADVLILDPPRKGARRVCESMNALLPQRIIMISCNIASGARDGRILAKQGYRLRALRALDLFSYSGHVEAMSLWTR